MTPSVPPPRRRALALSGALLTLLLAPAVAPAAELPLDLGALAASSLTFEGLTYTPGVDSSDGEGAGSSVAGDCNLNGDGRADLVVGAPFASASPMAPLHGRAYLVFGDAQRAAGRFGLPPASVDPPSAGAVEVSGSNPEELVGSVVACADVDGDGLDDALIGSDLGGRVHVIHGDDDLAAHAPISVDALGADGFTIASAGFGFSRTHLAALGDLDGDGKEEIAIGTSDAEPTGRSGSGAVVVVAGRAGTDPIDLTTPGSALLTITGEVNDQVTRVAALGDVGGPTGDRDGVADLLVGAPGFDSPGRADSGAAFVIDGTATGTVDVTTWPRVATSVLFPVFGPADGAGAGTTVSSAGDADGDGFEDLAIGLGENMRLPIGGRERRRVYVVYGHEGGDEADLSALDDEGYAVDGTPLINSNDALGASLAPLGDVDGDGRDDLAIGAPGYDPLDGELTGAASTGAVYLVYGRTAAEGGLGLTSLTCEDGARLIGARRITGIGAAVAAGGPLGSSDPHLLVGAATGTTSNGNFVRAIPLADTPGACAREEEPPAPAVYDEVDWGFRENFRRYVTNGFDAAAPAVPISAAAGATCEPNPDAVKGGCDPGLKLLGSDPPRARVLRWALSGASATDGGDTTVGTIGRVTFRFPGHFFTLALSDPWFSISGDQVTVRARVDLDVEPSFSGGRSTDVRIELARFRLAGPAQRTASRIVWRTEPGVISDAAVLALGSFLPVGSQLDPVTITIPRSLGELPQEPTVPVEREPETRVPDTRLPDPPPPARRAPPVGEPRPPRPIGTVTSGPRRATVRRAGAVLAGTIGCAVACSIGAPRVVTVRIGRGRGRGRGARRVRIAVSAPRRVGAGSTGRVRLRFDRGDLRALAGRTVRLRVPIVLRANGATVRRTLTVTVTVPRARSPGARRGAPGAERKGAR